MSAAAVANCSYILYDVIYFKGATVFWKKNLYNKLIHFNEQFSELS